MVRVALAAAAALTAAGGGFLLAHPDRGAAAPPPPLPTPPVAAPAGTAEQVLGEVAIAAVRGRLRGAAGEAASFRDLTVVRFGPADERAVCGKVRVPGQGESSFILRILLPRGETVPQHRDGRRYATVLEQGPGLPAAAGTADRLCRDPVELAAAAASAAPPPEEAPPEPGPAPIATVQLRSPARVRAGPGGGAEVLRVAPQGTAFRVFARAPGGWMQVGETGPQGWVHASLVKGGP